MGIEPTRVRFDSVAGFAHVWRLPVKMVWYSDQKHIGSSPTINGTRTTVDTTKNNTLPGRFGHFNIVQHISTAVYFSIFSITHVLTLSTHNGPQVPTGCRLRVGREWRTWQLGKCLVFDDSYEHEERAYSGWPWRTNEIMRGKSWEK